MLKHQILFQNIDKMVLIIWSVISVDRLFINHIRFAHSSARNAGMPVSDNRRQMPNGNVW